MKPKSVVALAAWALFVAVSLPATAVDVDKWCDTECKKIVTAPGIAGFACWMCCYETCRCRGGAGHCDDAVENCAPERIPACQNMVEKAPKPPK